MTDQPQRSSYRIFYYWVCIAVVTLLPVVAVNSTSTAMRVTWVSMLLFLGFGALVVHLQKRDDPEFQYTGAYLYNKQPVVTGIIVGLLVITSILAIAATYATPDGSVLWQASLLISHLGEAVFPLVGKYAIRIAPPLAPDVLYKTETVTTLFLLAGAIIAILMVPYIIFMPRKDTLHLQKMQIRMGRDNWVVRNPLILLPFAILVGFAMFLGWFEFDPQSECFRQAACYAHDDLLLIAVSGVRIFGSYGFWLATLMILIRASETGTEQH